MTRYHAGLTFDAKDMAKAKEFKRNSFGTNWWRWPLAILCVFIAVIFTMMEPGPILIVGMIFAVIGLWALKGVQKNQGNNGCEQWYMWMRNREFGYYGGKPSWQDQAAKNAMKGVFQLKKDYVWLNPDKPEDVWTSETAHCRRYTDQLLYPNNDGSYDYSKLFEELAYQFLVICKRINAGEGKYCCFVETIAHQLWGVNSHNPYCDYWPGKYEQTAEATILREYPIATYQMYEFTMFNYNMSDTPGGWLWGVWQDAFARYKRDLQMQPSIKPYNMNKPFMEAFRQLETADRYYDRNPPIAADAITRRRIVEQQYYKA